MTRRPTPEKVAVVLDRCCNLDPGTLASGKRTTDRRLVLARGIFVLVAHDLLGLSHPEIARLVGAGSHSTQVERRQRALARVREICQDHIAEAESAKRIEDVANAVQLVPLTTSGDVT